MRRKEIDTIRELANLKIEDILDALGIEYRERYHSLTSTCHIHGGDNRTAFSWHVERGTWRCFSRNCDDKYGKDVFGLVRGIRQCGFLEAVEWTKRFVNLDLSDEEIQEIRDSRANKDFIISVRRRAHDDHGTYSWECLKKLAWHDYLVTERGFSREIVEAYHIGACLKPHMYMSNRIVIPVIDASSNIVGFTGRSIDKNWKKKGLAKWLHSKGSWKDHNVFNAHRAVRHIEETGVAIICEGPFDVLRLEEAGVHNAVAILGKELHDGQMTALMDMGALTLVVALDNDKAGKIGASKALKTASYFFDIKFYEPPEYRNDIGDMTVQEIKEDFCAKIKI